MKIKHLVLSLALVMSAISHTAHALNAQGLRYYFTSGRGLSHVESKPKPKNTASFGFGFNYALNPLEVGSVPAGVRVSGVVDHLYTLDLAFAYSFTDRIAVGIGLPLHATKNLASLTGTAMETAFSVGDVLVAAHINIINPGDNALNAGFGVVPFVSLPSGKLSDFTGDTNATGGLLLSGDMDLNGHYLGLNVGARLRKTENFNNLSVANEFMYNFLYHHVIVPSIRLDGFVEINGSTVLKDFWQKANESPFEARLGLTKAFMENDQLKVTLANGIGLGNGFGAPDYRAALKINYDYEVNHRVVTEVVEEQLPARIERIERELKELTIYYPTDGDQVDPFYDQKIAGIAKILKDNPDLGPLYIVGHTDDVGGNTYNQRLSERRAKGSYDSIVSHGLDPRQIVSAGMGEDFPVVPNTSDANRSLNRRTLFTFIKPVQLQEKYKKSGEVIGINTLTGKKNDSYTEVLKEFEYKKAGGPGAVTGVKKQYKDSSEVLLLEEDKALVKDRPGSEPKEIDNTPKSKTYYDEEVTEGGTVIKKKKKFLFFNRKDKNDKTVKSTDDVGEENIDNEY